MTNIHIVYGAPLSGKSTYVRNNLSDNDLMYDYDDLMQSLSGLPYQTKNDNLSGFVLDMRKAIMDRLLYDKSIDNAYIITTFISKDLIDLDAEYIKMDTDYMTCINRLKQADRSDKDELHYVIGDWFQRYHSNGNVKEQYGTDENKARFYKGSAWYGPRGMRQRALDRDNHECQMCKREGRVTVDSERVDGERKVPRLNVHHIMEIEYYPELALELDNLMTVCISCHNRIHNKMIGYTTKKESIWEAERW